MVLYINNLEVQHIHKYTYKYIKNNWFRRNLTLTAKKVAWVFVPPPFFNYRAKYDEKGILLRPKDSSAMYVELNTHALSAQRSSSDLGNATPNNQKKIEFFMFYAF